MRILTLFFVLTFISISAYTQQVVGFKNSVEKSFLIQRLQANSLNASFSLSELSFDTLKTEEETFLTLTSNGYSKSYSSGEPDLPVYNQLLVVPSHVNLSLTLNSFSEELIQLSAIQAGLFIKPAIASISKSQSNPDKVPLVKGKIYQTNSFNSFPVVELREVGIMRDVKIYELIYQPVIYNAVSNQIKVRHHARIELNWNENFIGSDTWNFTNLNQGKLIIQSSKAIELRETYVLVSPLKYKETLQPFVQWKIQQGFYVIEAYIGEAIASADKNLIKTYLTELYNSPADGIAAPAYLLIVGDVVDVPAWYNSADSHVTDLYYAEYTNDYLPDVYYGRFSAVTAQQLKIIIDKTLYVEKGAGNKRSYQNDHLLISGVDASYAPVYGNGALNYFIDNYSIPEFGVNAHYYLYGSGSPIVSNSSQAKQAIFDDFNAGVGIAYYTAHCNASGWSNPQFTISDIVSVNNSDYYPLMIGNCCQSYSFNSTSFGEEIVRAAGKGAVAYIGATNLSYWDEDYFWGVGFTSNITANPTYEATGLGSWDAWFHTHNETVEKHAYTAGQIVEAGNMTVQSSNSDLKKYYWEIYGIMGDPSLVPAKYQTQRIEPKFNELLMVGQNSLEVTAAKGAKITLIENGTLLAFNITDESEVANLSFEPLLHIGDAVVEICVSHPDYAPYIDTLKVIGPNGPYLVVNHLIFNDSSGNQNQVIEYGETIDYYFEIKNFGSEEALNGSTTFSSSNQYVEVLSENNPMELPTIMADESYVTDKPFRVLFKNNIPDQELVSFMVTTTFNGSLLTEYSFTAKANAPNIQETNWLVDQTGVGNANGIIEANEEVTLTVFFSNIGNAQVSNTTLNFNSSNSELLAVSLDSFQKGGFDISETKAIDLIIKGDSNFFPGTQVFINYSITAGDDNQYLFGGRIPIILGQTPDVLMDNGTEQVITGNFYDSGGPSDKYTNNEAYTLTLIPFNSNEGLLISFDEFDVESMNTGGCWDKLSIYDGPTIDAPLLGSFCTANYKNYIQSQNSSGALTFKFESDGSTTKTGWKGFVSSTPKSSVAFKIVSATAPIFDATVNFVNTTVNSNESGFALFNNTLNLGSKSYSISKSGYFPKTGKIEEINGDSTLTILLEKLPDICFTTFENTQPLADVALTFNENTILTDSNGNATFIGVLPGTKSFRASKAGYIDTIGTIVVGTIDYCYSIKMRHKPTFLVNFIVTDEFGLVNNAIITLEGVSKTTSQDGTAYFEGLYEGNYGFTIEKEGYILYNGALNFTNADITKQVTIYHKTFGVVFNVTHNGTPLANANISVLDDVLVTAANGNASMYGIIPENDIPFDVTKEGFNKYIGAFTLIDSNVELNLEMSAVGIYQNQNSGFSVYPNPIAGDRKILVQSENQISQLNIYNYTGAKLVTINEQNTEIKVDFSGFSSGIYILQAKVGDEWIFEKVIVE